MTAVAVNTTPDAFLELARRVRAARAKAGMTRRQLAAASQTSERYLAHIEAGTGNPSFSVLSALAVALDTALPELLPLGGEVLPAYEQAVSAVRRLPPSRLPALQHWIGGTEARAGERGRRIVLVGLRGAGKTSLGQALAKKLGCSFLEMSKEVEEAYGGELGLLIELGGQGALHRHESEVWEQIQSKHEHAVIAAPGGVVADGPLYDRVLATAHTIWLSATPEDHMSRVMKQGDFRPMGKNPRAMHDLKAILDARTPDYSRAGNRLDTSAQNFEHTLALLTKLARDLINQ
jgi:XRE family transcriptional regulator, aerobic/anaerobic benzoate catabolism transcriptional regulator